MKQILISVVVLSLFMGNVFAQTNELPLGEPIAGTLTDDQLVIEYPFSAKEGDRLTISASSSDFDTFLKVSDSDGEEVVSNDDANGSLNSLIDNFIVKHDGDYTLTVTSSNGTEIGEYTLSFNPIYLQILAYGESITGILDETTSEQLYQFEGTQGDIVSIQMTSSTINSFVSLSNSEYEMISDDDSGGSLNAMIGAFTLPATDTYIIRASTYEFKSYGEFTVSLDKVEATPIALNETIKGTLSDKPLYYSFTVDSSTLLSAYVVSDDGLLDSALSILQSEYGYSLGFDDDSGYIYDAELNNLFISEAGQIIVIVIPVSPDTEGDFELSIITSPSNALYCDSSQTLLFNQKITQIIYTMDVKAKQNLTFNFHGHNASLASLYSTFTLNGEYLPVDFINDVDEQITVEINAPLTGKLDINVSDYAFRSHTFQLDISCP